MKYLSKRIGEKPLKPRNISTFIIFRVTTVISSFSSIRVYTCTYTYIYIYISLSSIIIFQTCIVVIVTISNETRFKPTIQYREIESLRGEKKVKHGRGEEVRGRNPSSSGFE